MTTPESAASGARYLLYLPRLVGTWNVAADGLTRLIDGTLVFADVSGFTALSEELAKQGKVGSEQVTEIINGAFAELLTVARLEGGDLLSFGGDALLLLFMGEDHPRRAATAADEMQAALDDYQRASSPVPLAMTVGVATGPITAMIAGATQRELFVVGPTVDEVIRLEGFAEPGQSLMSAATADHLEPICRGTERAGGFVLAEAPEPSDVDADDLGDLTAGDLDTESFIPPMLRDELRLTGAEGEHRGAIVCFVRVQGVGSLVDDSGDESAQRAIDRVVETAAGAANDHGVTLLASDVDAGGAKLILTAGVPTAVPDAEERMLRTARRLADLQTPLRLHVGIAAGDVFAGDLGAAFRRGYTVMGDTVNLAARLAGQAETGQVLTTWRVVDGSAVRFEIAQLPPVALKGKSFPVKPLAVGALVRSTGGEADPSVTLTGRDVELDRLLALVDGTRHGRGGVIELVGPPGIGKSRLLAEMRAVASGLRTMVIECEEYESGTAYHAAGILLRHVTELLRIPSADETGRLLGELVEQRAPHLLPWLPLLAIPLDARVDPTPETDSLDPAYRTARLAEAVGRLLATLAPEPAVFGFDNAQWMDAASREMLDAVMLRHADLPWAWTLARRPEGSPVDDRLAAETIELAPLNGDQSLTLLRAVCELPLAPHVENGVIERAGGNPLFLIELATADVGDDIPDSVERVLASRIDRLGIRERRLLRYAAVLGQQFDLDLLVESLESVASGLDDPEVMTRLGEFLDVSALGRVRFRQPLVRDIAYSGLAFGRRQEIHGLVGETIERRARHRAVRQAAVLSLHFEQAQRYAKAWDYAVAGGERAAARYANREAATLFDRALSVSEHLEQVDPIELARVSEALGDAAELAGDLATADTAYVRASEGAPRSRVPVLLRKRAQLAEKSGDYERAIELLETALELTDRPELLEARIDAMVMMAGVLHRQGDYPTSAQWCREAIEVDPHRTAKASICHALYLLSLNQTHLGDPDKSLNAKAALAIAEELEDWIRIGKIFNNLAIDAYYEGRWGESEELNRQGREASARAGDVLMTATQDNNLAEMYSDQGRFEEALALFRQAEAAWRAAGYRVGVAFVDSNLGRLARRRGDLPKARERLERALAEFDDLGATALSAETRARLIELMVAEHRWTEALEAADDEIALGADQPGTTLLRSMLHRMAGHALTAQGSRAEARSRMETARDLADEAGARFERALALRALGGLGDDEAGHLAQAIFEELGATRAASLFPQRDPTTSS